MVAGARRRLAGRPAGPPVYRPCGGGAWRKQRAQPPTPSSQGRIMHGSSSNNGCQDAPETPTGTARRTLPRRPPPPPPSPPSTLVHGGRAGEQANERAGARVAGESAPPPPSPIPPPPPHPPHPPIPPFQRTPNSAVWSPHQPWPGGMRRTVAQEGRGSERSRGEGARASSHRACISTAREAGEGRKGRDHDWPGAPHVGAGAQTKHVTATAQGDLHHCSERRADSARFRVGPQCANARRLHDDSRRRQI